MGMNDWNESLDGKKMPPLYGGARDLSHVKMGREDITVEPEDIANDKYTFRTNHEFKFLVSHYLDMVRRKKGILAKDLSKRLGKVESAFHVIKHDGVSTFILFFRCCDVLNIDPVDTLKNCLELHKHFKNN